MITIGWKAFAYCSHLEELNLTAGLEAIDGFAFMHTGIRALTCPSTLLSLGEKAFYSCHSLRSVTLNNGIASIGEGAFAATAVKELHIPQSVVKLGARILDPEDKKALTRMFISDANPVYASDSEGFGTYKRGANGFMIIECRGNRPAFDVMEGTVRIGPKTFARQRELCEVHLPEGITHLGEESFRGCRKLERISLPISTTHIGARAFFESGLRELFLPENVEDVDDSALLVNGSATNRGVRHPFAMEVDEANPFFYLHTGVLIRRGEQPASGMPDGSHPETASATPETTPSATTQHASPQPADKAIFCDDTCTSVVIPPSVKRLGSYLFLGASNIDSLTIHDSLDRFDSHSFGTLRPIGHIHLIMAQPLNGRSELDLYFDRGMSYSLSFIQIFWDGRLNGREMLKASDQAIYYMTDRSRRARLMLWRLSDPFMLSAERAEQMSVAVRRDLANICEDFAKRHYNEGLEQLIELGFINDTNIDDVIARVHETGNIASSGYLLEMKHRLYGTSAFSEYDI